MCGYREDAGGWSSGRRVPVVRSVAGTIARVDLYQLLDCLVEAETDSLGPEHVGRRYLLVGYELDDSQPEVDGSDDGGAEHGTPRLPGVVVLGEADSVYAALDLLAAHFVGLLGGEPDPGELTADYRSVGVVEDDYERWLDDGVRPYAGLLRAIRTPRRRMLAYYLMGFLSGPMDVVTDRYWRDVYLGAAPLLFPGSRFVFLISAAPPAQEEAYGILECQPVGVPTQADRALAEACRGGDAEAVTAAIAAVDRPDTLKRGRDRR